MLLRITELLHLPSSSFKRGDKDEEFGMFGSASLDFKVGSPFVELMTSEVSSITDELILSDVR